MTVTVFGCLLVLVSIEKIYLEVRQRNSAAGRIFVSSRCLEMSSNTISSSIQFDIHGRSAYNGQVKKKQQQQKQQQQQQDKN